MGSIRDDTSFRPRPLTSTADTSVTTGTAVVTGGASGLGRALVSHLRSTGWKVAILDVNAETGTASAHDTGSRFYRHDVTSAEDWERAMREIATTIGPVNKVFLNAGIMSRPPAAPINDDIFDWMMKGSYDRVMRVNVDGALLGLQSAIPVLTANGGGSVTVTSSAAGLTGLPFDPFYSMSKHAVVGMIRSFAPVLKKCGIRLNAFCPGAMNTAIVPKDVVAAGYAMLEPDEAAQSCVEVSDMASTGGVWIRGPGVPLWEYRTPAVEVGSHRIKEK